jgi:spermidine/putrescine transport system ATP-binding protein
MLDRTPSNLATSNQTAEVDLELRNVFKIYRGSQEPALRGIDFSIHRGEFFSILGPSGCGKTTTLRLIAGFEDPSAGDLLIQGRSMRRVPPYHRSTNTVFQSYALFNHLSVWENVAFGLRIKKRNNAEITSRVNDALRLVQMEALAMRSPHQLSGGQQQRVALARALVNQPSILLLDEPLAALDLKLRKDMQVELSSLQKRLGITFILVTHDQEEALSLSDRVAVMNQGRVEQIGTPREVYEQPQSAFVADFIGDTNLVSGRIQTKTASHLEILTHNGLKVIVASSAFSPITVRSDSVIVSVRPEKIQISLDEPSTDTNCFAGQLKQVLYRGTHVHYIVELRSGDRVMVMQSNTMQRLSEAEHLVYVQWSAQDCQVLASGLS